MNTISASEIGEFYYCQLAWLLRKQGNKQPTPKEIENKIKVEKKPEERIKLVKQLQVSKKIKQNLEKGIERHKKIGKQIVEVEKQEIQINYIKYIGYGILGLVILAIIFSLLK